MNSKFGPQNEDEEVVFAEARYIVNIQCSVQALLNKHKINSYVLGNMLGDHKLVERLFSPDGNVTVRELGKIFHTLVEYTIDEPV